MILSHERVQIHASENLCSYATNPPHFRVRELLLCAFRLHFNHARRGRALAAISGKVPSVSGVWFICFTALCKLLNSGLNVVNKSPKLFSWNLDNLPSVEVGTITISPAKLNFKVN